MELKILHNKALIYNYLKQNSGIQIYLIGDLDDFFWPKTIWYSLIENNEIKAIALLYVGMEPATLLCFNAGDSTFSRQLINTIKPFLPKTFNAHLSAGLMDIFRKESISKHYGFNTKMLLKREVPAIDDKNVRKLSISDLANINEFYSIAYPQNWFDKRMLETNKYFGYFIDNQLVGISGIHVYSEEYKVAALGNIATHPNYRGQQIATKLTTALCCVLQKSVDSIGLNVKSDNDFAIRCYEKIGFELIGKYDECFIKL